MLYFLTKKELKSLLLILLLPSLLLCQSNFKKGKLYFKDGRVVEAMIMEDFYSNMENGIKYKLNSKEVVQFGGHKTVRAFSLQERMKFKAFPIRKNIHTKKQTPAEWIYLKQLEEGAINLFVYQQSEEQWFFVQKDSLPLQRLYVSYRKYDTRLADKSVIAVDTVSTTDFSIDGFIETEKNFKKVLGELTKDTKYLKVTNHLKERAILNFIRTYNKLNKYDHPSYSYFTKNEIRFFLTGSALPINQYRSHYSTAIGTELEFINAKKNRSSIIFGFNFGIPIKAEKFEELLADEARVIAMNQVYFKFNRYLSIDNSLKPFIYAGVNVTYLRKGIDAYEALDNILDSPNYQSSIPPNGRTPTNNGSAIGPTSNVGSGKLSNLIILGVGVLYELDENKFLKLELSNRLFPNTKVGIGFRF